MTRVFKGNFTQQDPIPLDAVQAVTRVMAHGRLHRYNVIKGEIAEVALFEQEFAAYMGVKFALAVASGGYAIACALRALDVQPGDQVLTNAFTLAPVPGAIASLGAVPVFVGVTKALVIDLDALKDRIETSNAKVLLLSHMRGHMCDMEALMGICDAAQVQVIEDCAHTMGGRWKGVLSGRHGAIAAYSTQTYKHLNSGEGGILVSDDAKIMARATLLSGSYMLFDRHTAGPDSEHFEDIQLDTPNISGRMDNLRGAILRPQLQDLDAKIARWNERYRAVESQLKHATGLEIVTRPPEEFFVGSSIQFLLWDWSDAQIDQVLKRCAVRGVELKWFGGAKPDGFTSRYDSWQYAPKQTLPDTDKILSSIVDMRIPLTFSIEDCRFIGEIIKEEVNSVFQSKA